MNAFTCLTIISNNIKTVPMYASKKNTIEVLGYSFYGTAKYSGPRVQNTFKNLKKTGNNNSLAGKGIIFVILNSDWRPKSLSAGGRK